MPWPSSCAWACRRVGSPHQRRGRRRLGAGAGRSWPPSRTASRCSSTADSRCADGRCVYLSQRDVPRLQFAKAAISRGRTLLIEELGVSPRDVQQVLLAGSFGCHRRRPCGSVWCPSCRAAHRPRRATSPVRREWCCCRRVGGPAPARYRRVHRALGRTSLTTTASSTSSRSPSEHGRAVWAESRSSCGPSTPAADAVARRAWPSATTALAQPARAHGCRRGALVLQLREGADRVVVGYGCGSYRRWMPSNGCTSTISGLHCYDLFYEVGRGEPALRASRARTCSPTS